MSRPRENINAEIEMGWNLILPLIYKESGSNSRGGRSLSSTHLLVAPDWTPTICLWEFASRASGGLVLRVDTVLERPAALEPTV